MSTAKQYEDRISKKLDSYKSLVFMRRKFVANEIDSQIALWENVLLSSVFYCIEALPISIQTLSKMEITQNKIGKTILDLPHSTANDVVPLLLGIKPMHLKVLERKVKFILKLKGTGNTLLSACWQIHLGNNR
jgi:hypothetical protein